MDGSSGSSNHTPKEKDCLSQEDKEHLLTALTHLGAIAKELLEV